MKGWSAIYQEYMASPYNLFANHANGYRACLTAIYLLLQKERWRRGKLNTQHRSITAGAMTLRSLRNGQECPGEKDLTARPCKCTSSCADILKAVSVMKDLDVEVNSLGPLNEMFLQLIL